ncbi:hypothetical protein [Sporolactobacillus laevolacticus]|uniref:Uncharacterized protein n=1 Tax=Sporolactobacillus laevolacticus DSM 442 TaxID=1395513 RepID=V6IUG2_9BACL|nr:hypothetical protein [Sporolactobacillus laevolacticus]EST10713.1 hypothetical protein P343_15945 [Sporolactobacillus laevolacticus DSM 442]
MTVVIQFRMEDVQIRAMNNADVNQRNVQSVHCMFEGSDWCVLAETDKKERLSFSCYSAGYRNRFN